LDLSALRCGSRRNNIRTFGKHLPTGTIVGDMKLPSIATAVLFLLLPSRIHAFSSSCRLARSTLPNERKRTRRATMMSFPLLRLGRPHRRQQLDATTPVRPADGDPQQQLFLSNAELNRPVRRDVYNYDLWVQHRSPDRFVTNLIDAMQSINLRHLLPDTINMGLLATFICTYNALLVNGYDDWDGMHHVPLLAGVMTFPVVQMPSVVFGLTTPFLALLLGTYHTMALQLKLDQLKLDLTWLELVLTINTLFSFLLQHCDSLQDQHVVQAVGRGPQELGRHCQFFPDPSAAGSGLDSRYEYPLAGR
jgi:hypothetical protein